MYSVDYLLGGTPRALFTNYLLMGIHWIPLLFGLFFGLIPPSKLLSCRCKYFDCYGVVSRVFHTGGANEKGRRWWKLPLAWIDPVRGYVTATLLGQAVYATPDSTGSERLGVLLLTAILLLAVLFVQAERRLRSNEKHQTVSPTTFLAGMIVGLLPPMVAIATLALGFATALALTNFTAGYGAASFAALAVGLVFSRNFPQVGMNAFIVAFPMLVSWVRRTTLVMPVRCHL